MAQRAHDEAMLQDMFGASFSADHIRSVYVESHFSLHAAVDRLSAAPVAAPVAAGPLRKDGWQDYAHLLQQQQSDGTHAALERKGTDQEEMERAIRESLQAEGDVAAAAVIVRPGDACCSVDACHFVQELFGGGLDDAYVQLLLDDAGGDVEVVVDQLLSGARLKDSLSNSGLSTLHDSFDDEVGRETVVYHGLPAGAYEQDEWAEHGEGEEAGERDERDENDDSAGGDDEGANLEYCDEASEDATNREYERLLLDESVTDAQHMALQSLERMAMADTPPLPIERQLVLDGLSEAYPMLSRTAVLGMLEATEWRCEVALDLLGESVPSIPMEGDCGAAAAPVLRGSAPQKRRKKRKYKQVQLSQLDSEVTVPPLSIASKWNSITDRITSWQRPDEEEDSRCVATVRSDTIWTNSNERDENGHDMAQRLRFRCLRQQIPAVDRKILLEVFEHCNYSMGDTLACLEALLGNDETQARPTQAEGGVDASSRNASFPETEHFVDRSTGLPDIATKTLRSQRRTEATERRKETQWQETKRRKGRNKATAQGLQLDRREWRTVAHRFAKARDTCYRKATYAYTAGDGEAAKRLAAKGREYDHQMRIANEKAHANIVATATNYRAIDSSLTIDLHYLHRTEALQLVDDVIAQHAGEGITAYIVTGVGRHSAGGVAVLKPAVRAHLAGRRIRCREHGGVLVAKLP